MRNISFFDRDIRRYSLYFILLFFCLSLLSSCSKKLDVGGGGNSGGRNMLTINVKGVKNVDNGLIKGAFVKLVDYQDDGSLVVDREVIKANSLIGNLEFDFISSSGNIKNFEDVEFSNSKFSKLIKNSALEPVDEGIKYFIILYKKASGGGPGDYIDARLGTVGEPVSAWVNDVDDFVWYAYSFNSSDDIETPSDFNDPKIQTSYHNPLLYATGEILQSNINPTGVNVLTIEFDQKLSKLEVEVDCRSMYAEVTEMRAHFVGSPIAVGTFSIKGNSISDIIPQDVGDIQMRDVAAGSSRFKESVQDYYTVYTNLTNYSVQFDVFKVRYPNRTQDTDLLSKVSNNGLATFSGFTAGSALGVGAKLLKGTVKPYIVIPSLKILTYGPNAAQGYQAQSGTASGTFIRASSNIGPNSKYIRVTSPSFVDQIALTGQDELREAISEQEPDIIICSAYNLDEVSEDDFGALVDFLESGGVVFLLTETINVRVKNVLQTILAEANLSLNHGGGSGAVYKLNDVDPVVMNGVFGDVRGKYWGQDGYPAQYINGLTNTGAINIYTRECSNYDPQTNPGITMFRHKEKHLFFCGDTGFLAGKLNDPSAYSNAAIGINPFRVDDVTYFSIGRSNFGFQATANSYLQGVGGSGSFTSYNSQLFGNVLAWLVERVYFWGRDVNGTLLNDEVIQTKEDKWNFTRN